jgi:LysR family glycine cleavage system transcriptional activator
MRGPHFTQEGMAVHAALDGQGVALIGDKLIEDHLSAGSLVCPFTPEISTPLTFSHYLLSPKGLTSQPKVTAFREWLINEVRDAAPVSR